MLLDEIRRAGMAQRVQILSFDWRTLQAVQRLAPEIPTVYLSAQQNWLDNIAADKPEGSKWTAGIQHRAHDGGLVVVPRDEEVRDLERGEHVAQDHVLVRRAVVGEVTGGDDDIGPGRHRVEVLDRAREQEVGVDELPHEAVVGRDVEIADLGDEHRGLRGAGQTARRSRAPVSADGWRSFDIARASI